MAPHPGAEDEEAAQKEEAAAARASAKAASIEEARQLGPWAVLHSPCSFEERLAAAQSLLKGKEAGIAGWLLQWLMTKGWANKSFAMPVEGCQFLNQLLGMVSVDYPLGAHVPYFVAQVKVVAGNTEKRMDGTAEEADKDGRWVRVDFGEEHARLLRLLACRPARSFAPAWNQALDVFQRLVGLHVRQLSLGEAEEALAQGAGAAAQILLRALERTDRNKAFKVVLEALPLLAAWQGALPPEKRAPAEALLKSMFREDQIKGFELLASMPNAAKRLESKDEDERPKKRAKTEEPAANDWLLKPYQHTFFTSLATALSKPGETSKHCAALVEMLFSEFVAGYRKSLELRELAPMEVGDSHVEGLEAAGKEAKSKHGLSCEFWFFLQASHSVRAALQAAAACKKKGEEGPEEAPLVRSLVAMWALVRSLGVYRPREDLRLVQAKTLDSFSKLMLKRLTALADDAEAAHDAREWEGLIEVLLLDTSPFESRLDEVWATATDLCPKGGAPEGSGLGRLAAELLSTYAKLSDLPSCLASLSGVLAAGPGKRARLLGSKMLQLELRRQAGNVSEGAMPQVSQSWEALLKRLPEEEEGAGKAHWSAILLQHLVDGVRPTELAAAKLRGLVLRSFEKMGAVPEAAASGDGLRLALCGLGRRLLAWELPVVLVGREGEAAELEGRVSENLAALARRLVTERKRPELYIQAAITWVAFGRSDEELQKKVLDGLWELAGCTAAEEPPDAHVQQLARGAVCDWVPLLAGLTQHDTAPLVSVLVPRELQCWSYVAQCWEGEAPLATERLQEKAWWPVASLWVRRPEALTEPLPVRAGLWRRLADVATRATAKPGPKQLSGLAGLQGALLRTTRVSFNGLDRETVVVAAQATAACVVFACGLCKQLAAGGDDGLPPAVHLLALALACMGQMLEMAPLSSASLKGLAEELLALVLNGSQGPIPTLVAKLLAGGSLGAAARPLLGPFSSLVRGLMLQSWKGGERRRWFLGLAKTLASPGLSCSGSLEVLLPHPMTLLSQPGERARLENSLQLLLALYEGLGDSHDDAEAISLRLDAASPGSEACKGDAAGLVLSLLARAMQQRARLAAAAKAAAEAKAEEAENEEEMDDEEEVGDEDEDMGAAELPKEEEEEPEKEEDVEVPVSGELQALLETMQLVAARPEAVSDELRKGLLAAVQAWSAEGAPWRSLELWQGTWVPAVIQCVEIFTSKDGAVVSAQQALDILAEEPTSEKTAVGCLGEMAAYVSKARQGFLLCSLAKRVANAATAGKGWLRTATGLVASLGVVLQNLPWRYVMNRETSEVLMAVLQSTLGLTEMPPRLITKELVAFRLCHAAVLRLLYLNLAAPWKAGHEDIVPWSALSYAESLVFSVAAHQARLALHLSHVLTKIEAEPDELLKDAAGEEDTGKLVSSACQLLSSLLNAAPKSGKGMPAWRMRPALVLEAMRPLLEAVYEAPAGTLASAAARDVSSLWACYSCGGTSQGSAGRMGQESYAGRMQRAAQRPTVMLLAHALEQQRKWPGIDASAVRSLRRLAPAERKAAREGELAKWKEAVAILEQGLHTLLASLEGLDELKQSLYTGLREPLGTMFKELNERFLAHGKYKGDA